MDQAKAKEKWTRDIPGIDGSLTATQTSAGTITLLLHDLQGNVVGTAALSETETKLLTKYNSTEFGVPLNGTPPTKYSWLGAAGVASESSSGLVTQDGTTYVPQTGRSLDTQGTRVPVPEDAAVAYTDPLSPWVIEGTEAASQQRVNTREAEKALAEANKPAGETPFTSPSWWCGGEYGPCEGEGGCNEETEGCGPDPEHGDDTASCGVWVSWKHYLSNDLGVNGHFVCNYDVTFEIQTALLLVGSNGHYTMVDFSKHVEPFILSMVQYSYSAGAWGCTAGAKYQAWAWGRYWGANGQTVWDASAEDGHYETCPTEIVDVGGPPDDK